MQSIAAVPDLGFEGRDGPKKALRLGLVGVGKIARDQHLRAIAGDPDVTLIATADPAADVAGVPHYPDIAAMLAGGHLLDAVAICTPPGQRYELACAAMAGGLHVLLEKPPTVTLAALESLKALAAARRQTLFATWHPRAGPAVEPACDWLAGRRIDAARVQWCENVRDWHPGQDWLLGPGGFGVFDPGINAFSILTLLLPDPVLVRAAKLTRPRNRNAPTAATISATSGAADIAVTLDMLHVGVPHWDIAIEAEGHFLHLGDGGHRLVIDGQEQIIGSAHDYPALYQRFVKLIAAGQSDVDPAPLRMVADSFLMAEWIEAPDFHWEG